MFVIGLSVLLTGIFTYLYYWYKNRYKYFEKYGIPYLPPTKVFGNLTDLVFLKSSPTQTFADLYNNKIAENEPFVGIFNFHKPALLIRDPELVKQIFIKDFNYFYNRSAKADPHFDALGAYNLVFIKNPEWKILRNSLTPFFTSGKLKNMFPLMKEVADEVDTYLCNISENKPSNWKGIEFKDFCARYTTDVIASTAFGVHANSIKNPNAEFRKHGAEIMKFNLFRAIEVAAIFFIPEFVPYLRCTLFDKASTKFLRNAVSFVMEERERTGKKRNDLIDILIELKNSPPPIESKLKFEGDVLIAQSAIFFVAGFETSSAAISFALYEIAKNIKIQKRLRQEIQNNLKKYQGNITYDSIYEMDYLTALIYETTRCYPTLPFLDRQCSPPAGEDGYSLKPFSDFVVPRDMVVYTPIYPIHRDPKYFPNPDAFDPERFLGENKNDNKNKLLGFGIGPHNCIGERLGLLQVKLGLVNVLRNHYVKFTENTPKVLVFDKKAFILQVLDGLYLDIVKDPLY